MKKVVKSLSVLAFCFAVFSLSGCSLLIDMAGQALESTPSKPVAYPGFATQTKVDGGYKAVVENMKRGSMTTTIRIDKDTSTYDAIYFDVTVYNTGKAKLMADGDQQFKLITDEGNLLRAKANFKGGFDGHYSEGKSLEIYPGTKKSGEIAFALKKESKPIKLIFETGMNRAIEFDLP